MGASVKIESYMYDYSETDGVIIPMKTLAKVNGMDAAMITFDKVETDILVDDLSLIHISFYEMGKSW